MRYRIYQIDREKDAQHLMYMNLSYLMRKGYAGDDGRVDSSIYRKVYDGAMDCDIEDLYVRCNMNPPEGYSGHSMSVSDVVVADAGDGPMAYYCDSYGFQPIEFDEGATEE